jgi:hypothetical protein
MSHTFECQRHLSNALLDLYVEWREESSAVQLAYDRWREASPGDRAAAFAAYSTALDREERASDIYAALLRQAAPPTPQMV